LGLFYSISHWNALFAPSLRNLFSQFEKISIRKIVLLFAILLLVYFIFRSRGRRFFQGGIAFAILTTGFSGMIFDLMIIFAFQSLYGYVFAWVGLLVASFMAGAACGAMLTTTALERIKDSFQLLIKIDLGIICFAMGFPFVFIAANNYLGGPQAFTVFRMLFLAVSFVSGLLVGSQFPLANRLCLGNSTSFSKTAGMLYASDLLGGWLGGIVGAVILLPVLGLTGTCITVGLLKLTSFTVLATLPGRHLVGGAT